MAMNRVWLWPFSPPIATSRDLAPSGTVTKYDWVLLRWTVFDAEKVWFTGAETTTVVMTCLSMPSVFGSSTSRIALLRPADFGAAWTLTVTGWFSGSFTSSEPTILKVFAALFSKYSSWRTGLSAPDVRVIVTSYVFFLPALRPPSRSYRPVPKPGVFRNWSTAVSTGAFTV